MTDANISDRLEEAFVRCRDLDVPLADRLQAFANEVQRLGPHFQAAVDALVSRLALLCARRLTSASTAAWKWGPKRWTSFAKACSRSANGTSRSRQRTKASSSRSLILASVIDEPYSVECRSPSRR